MCLWKNTKIYYNDNNVILEKNNILGAFWLPVWLFCVPSLAKSCDHGKKYLKKNGYITK